VPRRLNYVDQASHTEIRSSRTTLDTREPGVAAEAACSVHFLEERESVINYCSHQIIMNDEVFVNFDVKPCVSKTEPCRLTLKARTENIVNIPTNYKGLGLLNKTELSPGIYLAASLTRGENGVCGTSIINSTEQDQTVVSPQIDLQSLDEGEGSLTLTLSAVVNSDCRMTSLHNQGCTT